ncbi:methylenetetrahydrofolate reductase [Corynebacterium macginleyi]|uniref:Methylenetetrahydrofolate reductase n=2 Tax=Corynebacterium macginleyi TaxID=38290 RepID=A0ABS1Y310_9CORY|nr:methylenetetrahydrofolate reductase [Corynebacterium macginleyi]MBM0242767.1 methylenetetrahydrofolate reductase [Corynebacterium macginleyi]MBM0262912.1 methylenetetrahydrofolate reductase [Corynebacterium macginleyi]QRJ57908.1 methylenetetrahydrofolate reductase [Corynebacterium macginleyi]QRJ60060.1 methylenetetrahydrofolate reductase [Corynebacterium macginleyi]QRP21377.1 methylenetetrahydrofolate reductase [Corynebacterium macginleyi]
MSPRFSASAPLDSMSEEELMVPERLALSFEVIPPRHDADEAKIDRLLEALESYHPDYIAVTSSQRSGWLAGTTNFIERISRTTSMRPLAHLACTAGSRTELIGWTNRLVDAGVRGLLALRGDLPEEGLPEHYPQHADELISLIRQLERQQAARFAAGRLAVGVACYPSGHVESKNEDEDFDVLLKKQRLGADFAITQLFFDAQDFLRFSQKARLAGVHIPLIPGIMPMTSLRRVERMGELSGLAVPERVRSALAAATTPEEEYETGMELTAELARDIVAGGASGLHIYTHNNPDNTHDLLTRIGVDNDQR